MKIAERIQTIIHTLEVGRFSRTLQLLPLVLAVIGLAVTYNVIAYRCFSAPEAMDAAQVARNLAEGQGFSTDFIRPFSAFLIQKHNQAAQSAGNAATNAVDLALLKNQPHPDLANAPVYPVLLAGLFKLWAPDWEFAITVINQLLLLVVVIQTFLITRKLFTPQAAWLTALLTMGANVLWQFSISGQSTLLLMAMLLGLAWILLKIEELGRAQLESLRPLFWLAIAAGGLVGIGMLTRYAFGWVIIPTVVFLLLFSGDRRRAGLAVTACLAFAVVVTPWIIRNLMVSGTWFGTAGYAVVECTFPFPGTRLMQSPNPDMNSAYWMQPYIRKFLDNTSLILQGDLLRVAGGCVMVLFLAGLLLRPQQDVARRLRYFTVTCLGVFIIIQALGRTQLSVFTPDINSENLLVLLTPLMLIFAVGFFLAVLSRFNSTSPEIQLALAGLLLVLCWQPLASDLLNSRKSPVAYPPYYPPEIQQISGWIRPDELIMSDIPWAVAWYGSRSCAWATINSNYEFFLFNDYLKPVSGLYLTLNTLDQRLISECLQGGTDSWGNFAFKNVAANQVPPHFPLKVAPYGLISGLFLTDRQRWETE
jgi:hypothetical protein